MTDTMKFEVDKIVYLSPSKYKTVLGNFLGCAIDKSEYERIKNNKLVNLIGFDASETDLIYCLEKTKTENMKEDYRVFLRHYIEILKRTGGRRYVSNS